MYKNRNKVFKISIVPTPTPLQSNHASCYPNNSHTYALSSPLHPKMLANKTKHSNPAKTQNKSNTNMRMISPSPTHHRNYPNEQQTTAEAQKPRYQEKRLILLTHPCPTPRKKKHVRPLPTHPLIMAA